MRPIVDQRPFDLEKAAWRECVREIEDQEIGHEQIAQRMASVRSQRPCRVAVQRVEESQVCIETRLIERSIDVRNRKRIFPIVEIAQLDPHACADRASGLP